MTCCHCPVKQSQKMLKIDTPDIFTSRKLNMKLVFQIDQILINYSYVMTSCHWPVNKQQKWIKIRRSFFWIRDMNIMNVR